MKTVQLANAFCGPYQLDNRLAEADEYEIYEARHSESRGRRYFAKVLKPDAKAETIEAMEKEYELLKKLDCHGIPHAYRHSKVKDQPCLITEQVTGQTVADLVASEVEFDHLAAYIAAVKLVAFLHQENVVHNRVCPESFIFRESDYRLYLVDFSKIITPKSGGLLAGLFKKKKKEKKAVDLRDIDPTFVAPEVLEGKTPKMHSDVYSLGQLGFFLLGEHDEKPSGKNRSGSSGRTPRLGGGPTQTHAPSSRSLAAIQRRYGKLPHAVVEVIESCLRISPGYRPKNAIKVLNEIRPHYERIAARQQAEG